MSRFRVQGSPFLTVNLKDPFIQSDGRVGTAHYLATRNMVGDAHPTNLIPTHFYSMEVIILGSGTSIPHPKRGSPGIVVLAEGDTILIDGGSGTLSKLAQAGVPFQEIDRILYTHLHLDHTADLAPLLFACRNPEYKRQKDLEIIGPKGFGKFFTQLKSAYGHWVEPLDYELEMREVLSGRLQYEHYAISFTPVAHHYPSLAYRLDVQSGLSMVFSGDTDYSESLIELASSSDLLIIESSFPNGLKRDGHLTPAEAGSIATGAKAVKVVLTHLFPICDGYDILEECRQTFSGDVSLAYDLMRLKIG